MYSGPVALTILGAIISFAVFFGQYPKSHSLAIAFSTQAPTGNWDNNENCEETSVIMANAFLSGVAPGQLDPNEVQKSIDVLISWENANLGYNINTGLNETARMIREVFGLKTRIITNFTERDLKRELARNNVLILPVSLQDLNNPLYKTWSRLYHMVVIRGYTTSEFLVNDPGLSRGENNAYSFTALKHATADWDHAGNKLNTNRKDVLVVTK